MYKFSKKSIEKLNNVNEKLVVFISQLLMVSKYDFAITCGYRSIEEQNSLYAQGRTTPGDIVTNCKGGESKHNFGGAVDVVLLIDGKENWNEKYYIELLEDEKVKELMNFYGIVNGSTFKNLKDYPHFELI